VFRVDERLLAECRSAMADDPRVFWLVGGAGSGKSTIARAMHEDLGIGIFDMDARIYGSYHARFSPARHPASSAWSAAPDGLSWLLEMTWEEFDAFSRASLPEYLDLFVADLAAIDAASPIIVDGGVWTPALLARVVPSARILHLRGPYTDSLALWDQPGERSGMRDAILALPSGQERWSRFLDFGRRITHTIAVESEGTGIATCVWCESEAPSAVGARVCEMLGLGRTPTT
jgi:hypothetical protein